MKVIVREFDPKDPSLKRIKKQNLIKAKAFYQAQPFATKLYISIKTNLPLSFISDNWKQITK